LPAIAFLRNLLLLPAQLSIERIQRVIEALIKSRATFVGSLRACPWGD
jgi:hypothetical protein